LKKKLIILIILSLTVNIYSKDFQKTEKIINSILNESPDQRSVISHKKDDKAIRVKEKKTPVKSSIQGISSPDHVLLKTGISFYNSRLYGNALKKFTELTEKFKQSPYADASKAWIGKIHMKQYRYNDAVKIFQSIPEDSGEKPFALFNIGRCYSYKGDRISAIEYFQKVSSLFPEHELADNAMLRTGRLFMEENRGNQAVESIINIIQNYSKRETIDDAYYLLGKIFENDPTLKDIETARKLYRKFLTKAKKGEKYFHNSPLKERVARDVKYIEKKFFKLEN